jgi:hypothetical protein
MDVTLRIFSLHHHTHLCRNNAPPVSKPHPRLLLAANAFRPFAGKFGAAYAIILTKKNLKPKRTA